MYQPYRLSHRDVVLATVGSWPTNPASVVGKTVSVPTDAEGSLLNQNAVRLRGNAKLDQRFLFYLLKDIDFQTYIVGTAQGSASQASITLNDIFQYEFVLPPLLEQRAIASILGALDDKIELNRRMNATLEAMARALFQSWFVDFDPVRAKLDGRQPAGLDPATAALFPASFQDSPLGPIPLGWQLVHLKELTSKIGSGATPRGGSSVYLDSGATLIRSQNVHDNEFRWDGLARISDHSAAELRNVEVRPDDVLLNITGDSILRTCVVDPSVLPARVNQHVAIIRTVRHIPARFLHLYLVQPRIKEALMGMNAGATRPAVTKGHLESVVVLRPEMEILAAFDRATSGLYQQIESNRESSRTLASLRDSLLPRLLAGEVTTQQADIMLEAPRD
jgi:type I restriction enzyme, S subunit